MSFRDYVQEAITPPSGDTIAPTANTPAKPTQANNQPAAANKNMKAIWPGAGAPVERGMTVGLTGDNNLPVPGEVMQVDQAAKGVKIKNPTTGQEEWQNIDSLQPFMAGEKSLEEDDEEELTLERVLALAGIRENCSGGATGAGAIAIAPAATGKMKRRNETSEGALTPEYTPKGPAKTIIGDTKPNQASGKLSADLAASGKKTASRVKNGQRNE
jgi:hypothetical protein